MLLLCCWLPAHGTARSVCPELSAGPRSLPGAQAKNLGAPEGNPSHLEACALAKSPLSLLVRSCFGCSFTDRQQYFCRSGA